MRKELSKCAILAMLLLVACGEPTEYKEVTTQKIVKTKREAVESKVNHRINAFDGKVYPVTGINTVYYIVYTDGTFDRVDVGEYTMKEPGDTVFIKRMVAIKNTAENE